MVNLTPEITHICTLSSLPKTWKSPGLSMNITMTLITSIVYNISKEYYVITYISLFLKRCARDCVMTMKNVNSMWIKSVWVCWYGFTSLDYFNKAKNPNLLLIIHCDTWHHEKRILQFLIPAAFYHILGKFWHNFKWETSMEFLPH